VSTAPLRAREGTTLTIFDAPDLLRLPSAATAALDGPGDLPGRDGRVGDAAGTHGSTAGARPIAGIGS